MKKVDKMLGILLLMVMLVPARVFAQNSDEVQKMENIKNEIETYLGNKVSGEPYFLKEEAIKDKVSEEAINEGEEIYKIMCAYYNYEQGIETAAAMPIYGRWCGPGYGEGNGTPIDLLDTGCKQHDLCYKKYGRHKCSCDVKLVSYIDRNIGKMKGQEKRMASIIRNWASIKSSHVTSGGGNTSCKA